MERFRTETLAPVTALEAQILADLTAKAEKYPDNYRHEGLNRVWVYDGDPYGIDGADFVKALYSLEEKGFLERRFERFAYGHTDFFVILGRPAPQIQD